MLAHPDRPLGWRGIQRRGLFDMPHTHRFRRCVSYGAVCAVFDPFKAGLFRALYRFSNVKTRTTTLRELKQLVCLLMASPSRRYSCDIALYLGHFGWDEADFGEKRLDKC